MKRDHKGIEEAGDEEDNFKPFILVAAVKLQLFNYINDAINFIRSKQ